MTIYVEKSGTDLNNDVIEKGTENNKIEYDATGYPKVLSNGFRRNEANMWVYPLGVTLNQDDSFWGKIKFKTPISFGTNVGGRPFFFMSFINQANTADNGNNIGLIYKDDGDEARSEIRDDANNSNKDTWNVTLTVDILYDTEYYIIMSYDGSTRELNMTLYLASDDSVVHTWNTVTLTAGRTFEVDTFGHRTLVSGDGDEYWTNDWEMTYFKANSGTEEEESPPSPTPIDPEPSPSYETQVIGHYDVGCCRVDDIDYDSGVGQSFDTTNLTGLEEVTNMKIEVPLCKSEDFDGDIEVKLYDDLLNGCQVDIKDPVIILNENIPHCVDGIPVAYVDVEFLICPWQIQDKELYVTFVSTGATTGSFSIISTTPYSDRYHSGEKYLLVDGEWIEQTYQDICMKVYVKSDCTWLGWCEYKYIDWLWCHRKLVKIDLPGFGEIGGKIVDYNVGKVVNEPFAWLTFDMTFEEITLEQGCQ